MLALFDRDLGGSMLESVWSSMTSSMQMAAECMKQSAVDDKDGQTMEGLELFAQTIDSSKLNKFLVKHCIVV